MPEGKLPVFNITHFDNDDVLEGLDKVNIDL